MQEVKNPKNYYHGDIYKHIVQLEDKYGEVTAYSAQLRKMAQELEALGCTTKDYAIHVPILINKEKMLEMFNITDCPMFRTLYANYANIGGSEMLDVKITSKEKLYKGGIYLSTDDNSFAGAVGNQIKEMFPDRCKYERR